MIVRHAAGTHGVSVNPDTKGKKAGTVVFETPGGTLSLSIGGTIRNMYLTHSTLP